MMLVGIGLERIKIGGKMGFTNIEHGLDWQAASFINEFVEAYNERMPNKYGDHEHLLENVTVGQDIQLASFWRALQEKVEAEWKSSISRRDENGLRGQINGEWVYKDNIPESICQNEDLPNNLSDRRWNGFIKNCPDFSENGWRRATSYNPATDDWTNPDGAMWEKSGNGYGVMQVGDIIGPWVFKDLQVAIGELRYIWFRGIQPPSFLVGRTRLLESVHVDDDLEELWNNAPIEPTDVLRTWAMKTQLNQPRIASLRRSEGKLSLRDDGGSPLPAIEIALCGNGTYYFYTTGYLSTILSEFDDNGDGVTEFPQHTNIRTVEMGEETDLIGTVGEVPNNLGFGVPLSYRNGYLSETPQGQADFSLLIELDVEYKIEDT